MYKQIYIWPIAVRSDNRLYDSIQLTLLQTNRWLRNGWYFIQQWSCSNNTGMSKENKNSVPWVSKIPKRYKRNAISRDFHRSRKMASNFNIEIRAITVKCNKAGYPRWFIQSVIWDFITPLHKDESFLIPPNMFEVKKPFLDETLCWNNLLWAEKNCWWKKLLVRNMMWL